MTGHADFKVVAWGRNSRTENSSRDGGVERGAEQNGPPSSRPLRRRRATTLPHALPRPPSHLATPVDAPCQSLFESFHLVTSHVVSEGPKPGRRSGRNEGGELALQSHGDGSIRARGGRPACRWRMEPSCQKHGRRSSFMWLKIRLDEPSSALWRMIYPRLKQAAQSRSPQERQPNVPHKARASSVDYGTAGQR